MVLEGSGRGRRAKFCLARFIFAARSGSDIQFLVIIRLLGDEEGLKLLDCEFATKVAR